MRSVTDRSQTTTSSYPLKAKDKMKSGAVITFTDLEFCKLFIYEIHIPFFFFLLKPEILRAFNVKSYLQEIVYHVFEELNNLCSNASLFHSSGYFGFL